MVTCPVCESVCEETEELCPKCGARLKKEEEEEVKKEIKNPTLAATVNDPVTAEIFGDVLKDNNIPFAFGEENGAMHIGFGGGFIAVDVYVDEDDLEEALKLYEDVLNSESETDFEDFEEAEDSSEQ